jgi:HEPN domain-containing protein
LCFHAQQAAEKAIKAVYQHHDWVFRYVHDIGVLIAGLEDRGLEVPSGVQDCAALSRYAYQTRYPALTEPVSKSDYERAVEMASAALRWAEQVTQTS